MRFAYQPDPHLPALAWCARIERGRDVVAVAHGARVETHPRGFVDGAWDGQFASFDIAAAAIVCGTGGVAGDGGVRFVASTDEHGLLFSVTKDRVVHISNSPAFVLAAADEEADADYPFYPYDLLRIYRQGLHAPDGRLRLRSRVALHVHRTTIVSVDARGRLRFDRHPLDACPRDYHSYLGQLQDGTRRVLENAADSARRHPYRPLASLSSGYDSTAAAVLAKAAGCRDAFAYFDSRSKDPRGDCGAANARSLGMHCSEYDRWQYLELGRCSESEFGYGPASSVAPLAALEDDLAGRVLITGDTGDSIWDPRRARAFDAMCRPWIRYTIGLSAIEFRLRVGYQIFAPACISARHNRVIAGIAVSDALRPWSIGGDYDRPIPRRIAEEAGLPRGQFGMRKAASSHSHLTDPDRFSPGTLAHYRRFLGESATHRSQYARRYWRARTSLRHRIWDSVSPNDARVTRSTAWQRQLPFVLNATPIRIPWEFMFTFQWTIASVRGRYVPAARALGSPGGARS